MGLKIRRSKRGFAYYAEYKLGGNRVVYEKIDAKSAREARRMYAARLKELRVGTAVPAMVLVRNSRPRPLPTVVVSILKKLVDKQLLSEEEMADILGRAEQEKRQDRVQPDAAMAETVPQATEKHGRRRLPRVRRMLAENVAALRKSKHLSQEHLASAAGIDRTYVSQIEQGKRNVSLDVVEALAEALETSVVSLLSERA